MRVAMTLRDIGSTLPVTRTSTPLAKSDGAPPMKSVFGLKITLPPGGLNTVDLSDQHELVVGKRFRLGVPAVVVVLQF